MTKKDYIAIAALFARGYTELKNPHVRTGYNLAIKDFMRYAAADNPKFDTIKFAAVAFDVTKH